MGQSLREKAAIAAKNLIRNSDDYVKPGETYIPSANVRISNITVQITDEDKARVDAILEDVRRSLAKPTL